MTVWSARTPARVRTTAKSSTRDVGRRRPVGLNGRKCSADTSSSVRPACTSPACATVRPAKSGSTSATLGDVPNTCRMCSRHRPSATRGSMSSRRPATVSSACTNGDQPLSMRTLPPMIGSGSPVTVAVQACASTVMRAP
jgi:hypothetical protein